MKRIEARDLRPGDTFDYEYIPWKGQPPRLKKDRVKPMRNGQWRVRTLIDMADGSEAEGAITYYTEIGQTNHGYVRLMPDTVVVLISRGDEA